MTNLSIEFEDVPLERICEFCGSPIQGRPEKRFCGNVCGVNFEREESRLKTFIDCFCEALAQNVEATDSMSLIEMRNAQADSLRYGCLILEILERRSNTSPTISRRVLLRYKDTLKKYLMGWDEKANDAADYFYPFHGERND